MVTGIKTCSHCGNEKPFSDFSKSRNMKDGHHSWCKECKNQLKADWYAKNREKACADSRSWYMANKDRARDANANWRASNKDRARENIAAWRAANPERVKEYTVAWRASNHERVKKTKAAWHLANADKRRAYCSAWAKSHPELTRLHNQNRRARKRAAGGRLSTGIVEKLLRLQRGKCACCGKPLGDDYHLDHIMPLALGGTNMDNNIQLLRAECNQQKHANHPIDFMQTRGFLL